MLRQEYRDDHWSSQKVQGPVFGHAGAQVPPLNPWGVSAISSAVVSLLGKHENKSYIAWVAVKLVEEIFPAFGAQPAPPKAPNPGRPAAFVKICSQKGIW